MAQFTINLDDKPNLKKATQEQPELAREVIGTLVGLMEESFDPAKGIPWAALAPQLHKDLSFKSLVQGVLRGALDVKKINPDAFDALGAEVHPLSLLMPKKNHLDGGTRYYDWREHFKLPQGAPVDTATIAAIIQKTLRYAKYIKFEELAKALEYNQVATYRGLGERNMTLLPMYPALQYQQKHAGMLQVGKFMDGYGFLDCGTLSGEAESCPACNHADLLRIDDGGSIVGCRSCNAGYICVTSPTSE